MTEIPGGERNPMVYFLLAAVLVALDQLVKYLVLTRIPLYGSVPFLPHILELTYVQNTGAAFSIFSQHRLKAFWFFHNFIINSYKQADSFYLFFICIFISQQKILIYCAFKKIIFLLYIADLSPQCFQAALLNIKPVDTYFA